MTLSREEVKTRVENEVNLWTWAVIDATCEALNLPVKSELGGFRALVDFLTNSALRFTCEGWSCDECKTVAGHGRSGFGGNVQYGGVW